MTQYNVTGMSCAACSARVEKAVNAVDGVTSCAVSLLTNSMGVDGTAAPSDIIAAVEAAGYGASLKDGKKTGAAHVYINGAYDVGVETSIVYERQPCCNGSCRNAFCHYYNGN